MRACQQNRLVPTILSNLMELGGSFGCKSRTLDVWIREDQEAPISAL